MKDLASLNYCLVGLGLMGGSIAKAIRDNVISEPFCGGHIFATDVNPAVLSSALSAAIIDKAFGAEDTDAMLEASDVVFVCLYPRTSLDFLISHKAAFKPGSIVSDISGVKTQIFRHIDEITREAPFDFIVGHPMAGGEKEGFAASDGTVFRGRNYILMPTATNSTGNLALFKQLVTLMGFSRVVETDFATHDRKIGFTSQLCHVIASALVDSAEDEHITEFGGGSFEDLTRIAMINSPLWTELFLSNKENLLAHISSFENSLDAIKELIRTEDASGLQEYLKQVRARRVAMARIEVKA